MLVTLSLPALSLTACSPNTPQLCFSLFPRCCHHILHESDPQGWKRHWDQPGAPNMNTDSGV